MFRLLLLLFFCWVALPSMAQNGKDATIPIFFEKTYLHTDRAIYAQGDTLWFKAYLVNGQDNKPVNSSGTLYVELLAPDSARIIDREIIRLDNGLGNGDFTLADTLAAGNYRLRAYTNWMRNFGDNFVFEKNITILNTQVVPIAPDPKDIVKNKPKTKPVTAIIPATSIQLPIVRFYPEGGSLVNGISSLVAVKAEDGYGSGIAASGSILSSAGDTVARFSCDSLGMGLFALLPIAGQRYQAVVNKKTFDFPKALSKGLTLQVKQTDSVIHAIINSTDIQAGNTISIVVKHAGKTQLNQPLQLQNRQTAVKISTATLPEGISAITIYDHEGKPECERLVYIHHPNSKNAISITTNKKTYQPKEQAMITVNAQPNTNLSMAVVDAGIVPEQTDDIVSYLQLQSEIKGTIENPNRYFDTTNINRFRQLDLLLMTQGWRDFVWRRLADTAIHISYAAESGIVISGKVRDENLNKWLPGLNITLHVDGAKGDKILSTKSDSLGRFFVPGLILYGQQMINLTSVNDKGQSKGAITVDTLAPVPVKAPMKSTTSTSFTNDPTTAATIKQRNIELSKMKGVTQLKEVNITDKSKYQPIRVKGIPDNSFVLWGSNFDQMFKITPKDYELKTLRWFAMVNFKGAVPIGDQVGIHLQGGVVIPQLIINNVVPPFGVDGAVYYSMPIEKFKSIHLERVVDIHNVIKYLLFLNLKDGYLTDNPGSINTEIEGYYQARAFYKPTPNEKPSINDYRTTIHWEPYIKTDASGKATVSFYNALPRTHVRIIVEGITDTGIPLVATTNYEVK